MQGRPPSIREDDLLDAARDVFRAEGHAATSAKIARRAGVSEGILFYRYKSKEALLAAVIRREAVPPAALRDLPALAGRASVRRNVQRIVALTLDGAVRVHPLIEIAHTLPGAAAVRAALFADGAVPPPQLVVDLIAAYFEAEQRRGRMRKCDARAAAQVLFGGCIEHVRSTQGAGSPAGRKAFTKSLADLLCRGLAAEAGA